MGDTELFDASGMDAFSRGGGGMCGIYLIFFTVGVCTISKKRFIIIRSEFIMTKAVGIVL